jgi:hypothetical protein
MNYIPKKKTILHLLQRFTQMKRLFTHLIKNLPYFPSLALALVLICVAQLEVSAQSATQANISGTNSTIAIANNTATVVDPNITLTANGNISGFTVSITGSYTSGDLLAYNGTLPTGITSAAFSTATRSLVFSGTTTAANWQALMRTVTLRTTSAVCNPESRLVSFVVGIKYYNILNGHFYEYYATGASWTAAKAYASAYSYFGREGYLATITAASENSFSSVLVGQNSWIGCSDNYLQINAALGYTLYGSQTAAEGNFYWITGPERGLKINSQNAYSSGGIMAASGVYNNWTSGEPNDYGSNAIAGEEDYGHMYTSTGLWNDFPNTQSIGSIIEFGGMPNDNTTSQVVFTRNVTINGAPSGTINGGNVSVCTGTNSTTLTLTGLSGTVVRWESSLDNFLTAGTSISNTTTSYTATNISNTTYYRVIVNSTSGCSNLATSSTPIYVTTTTPGNIVAANNTICAGSAASFTLYGNSGNVVKWQVSTSSTFASAVTDISNTTTALNYTLSSTGTYYFRAAVQNNGCGSAVFTPAYTITVVSGTAPAGGTLSSNEHCGGTNTGTLTLSGYTGTIQKWQYSVDGGIIWTDVANVTNTLTYSGVSANRLYRVYLTNGSCGSAYSSNGSVTVYGTTVTRWDGGTSTAWQTASNWCGGIGDNGIDVVISATAGNHLVLDQNRIIGNLNFNGSNRYISLGNSTLTASGFSNVNSNNYIKTNGTGVVKTNIASGGSATFPVGDGSYNSLIITNNTGSADYFSVRVLNEVFTKGNSGYTSSMGRVKRTWDISKTNLNAGSGLTLVFNWNSGEATNLVTPTLYHYENNTWNPQSGSFSSTSTSLTYVGYTGTFSPFAIGSGLSGLPVQLVTFEAKAQADTKSTLVTWSTSSEKNVRYFDIQRSADGQTWESIGQVESTGNSNTFNSYSFTDLHPGQVNFYRLKQVDNDGSFNLHVIRKVTFDGTAQTIHVFPNPSNGFVEIITAEPSTYYLEDINGRIIMQGDADGRTPLSGLAAGLYIVNVKSGEHLERVKLIVQ